MKFVDITGKKRTGIIIKCERCGISKATRRDQPARYCSKYCRYEVRKSQVELTCAQCDIEFTRAKSKISDSRSGLHFCSRKCKDRAQRIGGIKEIQPPHYGTGPIDYRALFEGEEFKCSRCGYNEFDACVHIHHRDQDRTNNQKDNLLMLCANCHWAVHCNLLDIVGL